MSDTQFFVKGKKKGNERVVVLSSATLLVGKAPTKTKRIKMKVRMPLTGQKMVGLPEWVANAMEFVAKSHDVVSPQVEFSGFEIQFDADQLFEKAAKANKCQLRSFVVQESGESENPDVEMQFLIYAPFSQGLWKWCGQMGGEEFWAQFVQVDEPEEEEEDGDQFELPEGEEEPEGE